MTTLIRSSLLFSLCLIPFVSTFADAQSAQDLDRRMNNTVHNMEINPIWAPDDSALYIHNADQIIRIDTGTGKREPMIDFEAIEKELGAASPRIERFSIEDNGEFICLMAAGDQYATLKINNDQVERIAPKDDPFALRPVTYPAKSGSNGPESAIIFINNTDHPVQIFWADSAGLKQPYETIQPGSTYRQHTFAGHAWVANDLSFVAANKPGLAYLGSDLGEAPERPRRKRPDAKNLEAQWKASFRDHNLFVTDKKTGEETQLSEDGSSDHFYTGPAIKSPDGRYLVAMREIPGDNRHIDLVEAAPRDQLQPITHSIAYDKPGDKIAQRKPVLFDLKTNEQIPLDDALFPNPWDIDDFHWAPDSDRLFFVYNQRGHQVVRLLAVQAKTGKVAVVAEEKTDTFIDWTNKIYLRHLDETDEVLWMSQRSGWNHLYLIDRKTGKTTPITQGEWVVRGIEKIDKEKREITFRALGVYRGMDPYYTQYGRISFDGSNLTWLTEGDGTHTVSFSPKGRFLVDSWSRVNLPPIHELRNASNGKHIADLGKADATELQNVHPYLPEPFVAKGRDGKTDICGVIYRPTDLDPDKKYPVIENIYAGPQDFFTPKAFRPFFRDQKLAELGFIVVQIDGMGTNWRSKKFHDVCFKNLKDSGFPDRIAWIKAAAKKYPYMDLTRVGIYGSSAGGQNAMRAVIDHADFYKAAYSDSACHDNRMDKIWWNEQWMSWPVDDSYIANSNMEDAHKLGGKLFLSVGMMDSNVDPSSTYQVIDELIKADKDFELMIYPSGGHGAGMGDYGTRLRNDFFIRHLQ